MLTLFLMTFLYLRETYDYDVTNECDVNLLTPSRRSFLSLFSDSTISSMSLYVAAATWRVNLSARVAILQTFRQIEYI